MGPVMPPVKKSTLTTFPLGRHLAPGSQSPPRATRLSLGANFGVFCLNATAAAATVPRPLSRRRPSQQHHQQPAVRKRWAIGADGDDLTSLQWLHEDPCLLHGLGLGAQPRGDPCLSDGKLGASGSSSGGDGGRFAGGHAFGAAAAAKGCPGDGALLLQPLSGEDKPPYSFSCLIFLAMEEAPGKRLPVHSIYEWIAARFPYFARAPDGWKNSIRHNLSLNKCFRKADRGKDPGKGSLWGVQPEYRPVLLDALRRTGYWTRSLTDKPLSSSPSSSPSSPPLPLLQPVPLSPRRSRHAPRHGWSAFALRSSSSLVRAHRSLSSFHAADRRSSMVVKSLHGTGPWRGSRLDCADTVKPCPRSRGPWCRPATATAPALQPLAEGGVAESERRSEAYMRLVRGRDSKLYLKRGQGPWPSRRHPPAAGDEIGEACGPVAGGASGTGSGGTSDAGGMGKADVKPAATIGGSTAVVATEAVKPAVKPAPEPEAVGDSGGNAVDGAGVEAEHASTGVGTVPSDDTRNPGGGDHSAGVDVADGRSAVVVRRSGGGGSIRRAGCTNALADHNYGLPCPPPTPPPAPPVVPLQPPAASSGHVHRQTRREKPSGRRWKRACREAVKRGRVGREDGEVEQEGSEGVTTTSSSSSSRRERHRKRRRGDERREEQQQLSWEARVAGVDEDVREAVTSLLFLAGIDVGPLWRPPAGAAVALGAVAVAPARRGTAQLS